MSEQLLTPIPKTGAHLALGTNLSLLRGRYVSIVQCHKHRLHDCSEVRKNSDEFISVHLEAITNLIVY